MSWRSAPPNSEQKRFLEESLSYAARHGEGLPPELFDKLRELFVSDRLRVRMMKERARYLKFPGWGEWIELDLDSLGLNIRFDRQKALDSAGHALERRGRVLAKAEERCLYLSSTLVHEGTHALHGLSWNRAKDEFAAYTAECRFLANVFFTSVHPLVKNAAQSLHRDAVRDASTLEGLKLSSLI